METVRELAERSVELFNAGALDELVSMYAKEAVEITPRGNYTGHEAISQRLHGDRLALPDSRLTLRHLTVDGDTAVMECEFAGTHTGPLPMPDGTELPPTGQHVTFPVVIVSEMHDGQTTELRMYFDQLPMMMQLGVASPQG